jgi:peroxiredoxin Q/BCP
MIMSGDVHLAAEEKRTALRITCLRYRLIADRWENGLHAQNVERKAPEMVNEGDAAPDFELPTENGAIRLFNLRGQPVVVYFYPKDDTSGCTAEARDFSRLAPEFKALGVAVIGISPDSVASHSKFRTKHGLAVTLAADEEKSAAKAYGVWVEKSMYGRRYMGIERSTFLIDRNGAIAKAWRKVKVPGHASEVLEAARRLAKS